MMTESERERKIAELLKRPYRKVIRGTPEEGFLAEAPELPGCLTAGATEAEALANLNEAMAAWLESALLDGVPVPEPAAGDGRRYSGRMLVRMPRSLHRQLVARAEAEGVSANQMAVAILAQAVGKS